MAEPPKRNRNEIGPTGEQVAENLRRLRSARNLTTAQLAERLEQLGRPILATGITKIEKKARQVSVDDLVALALALEVAPSALLGPFTALPTDAASVTGSDEVPAFAVWHWLRGLAPLHYDPHRRRQTQNMEFTLYGSPEWLHEGKALKPEAVEALGLADDETLWLDWDEDGRPVMRRERDRG